MYFNNTQCIHIHMCAHMCSCTNTHPHASTDAPALMHAHTYTDISAAVSTDHYQERFSVLFCDPILQHTAIEETVSSSTDLGVTSILGTQ